MKLRDDLNACTPRLRRYVRALATGSPVGCAFADDIVHGTLMRALGARQIGRGADLVIRLYATATQLHRDMAVASRPASSAGATRPALVSSHQAVPLAARHTKLSAALLSLALDEREALLLVALEGFDHATTARILRISRCVLTSRLTQARKTLDAHLGTRPVVSPRERSVPHLRLVT